jgi:conjugative relaxase-like TrwC/TraI family protein
MLSIGKLGAGQHSYYLDKVAEGAEDYYSGEGEAEGYWLGDAAEALGLDGKVEPDQLVAMLTGNNPVTGEPLGLKSAPGREPVPGFDLTFSAPKSVSLTWALGGHPVSGQIKEAHAAAVAEALGYLERQACWTRRGRGGHEFVPGNGFLATAYAHRSSRAGDPQLHTHVLIANATKGPDGRWSRLYHPAIYEHAKTASYLYEAHLRHELTQRLGVEWQPVVKGMPTSSASALRSCGASPPAAPRSSRRREREPRRGRGRSRPASGAMAEGIRKRHSKDCPARGAGAVDVAGGSRRRSTRLATIGGSIRPSSVNRKRNRGEPRRSGHWTEDLCGRPAPRRCARSRRHGWKGWSGGRSGIAPGAPSSPQPFAAIGPPSTSESFPWSARGRSMPSPPQTFRRSSTAGRLKARRRQRSAIR